MMLMTPAGCSCRTGCLAGPSALRCARVSPRSPNADAVAGAVDAVDHHADRVFQAGVVADGADAADAGGGDGLVAGGGDRQARRQIVRSLMSLHAGVLRAAAPFSEVTTIGTSCRLCSRFWAVTTISATVPAAAAAEGVPGALWPGRAPGPRRSPRRRRMASAEAQPKALVLPKPDEKTCLPLSGGAGSYGSSRRRDRRSGPEDPPSRLRKGRTGPRQNPSLQCLIVATIPGEYSSSGPDIC